jgi:hypothetical protein
MGADVGVNVQLNDGTKKDIPFRSIRDIQQTPNRKQSLKKHRMLLAKFYRQEVKKHKE